MTTTTLSPQPNPHAIDTLLQSQTIAMIGYGNQGAAQAQNLRDGGYTVTVAVPENGPSWGRAQADGFSVCTVAEAAQTADVLVMAFPDTQHGITYHRDMAPNLRPPNDRPQTLLFVHGFSIVYTEIVPPPHVDVVLVSPKGIGSQVRAQFVAGSGVAALVGVHQNSTGHAEALAHAYAMALGCHRIAIIAATFAQETMTNLFSEQVVLCGGVTHLIQTAFDTLTERGYPKDIAYFVCLHELKLITDMIFTHGITGMRQRISDTARYGDLTVGPSVIGEPTRQAMRDALDAIESGAFAQRWMAEYGQGQPQAKALFEASKGHAIDAVGQKLRAAFLT